MVSAEEARGGRLHADKGGDARVAFAIDVDQGRVERLEHGVCRLDVRDAFVTDVGACYAYQHKTTQFDRHAYQHDNEHIRPVHTQMG